MSAKQSRMIKACRCHLMFAQSTHKDMHTSRSSLDKMPQRVASSAFLWGKVSSFTHNIIDCSDVPCQTMSLCHMKFANYTFDFVAFFAETAADGILVPICGEHKVTNTKLIWLVGRPWNAVNFASFQHCMISRGSLFCEATKQRCVFVGVCVGEGEVSSPLSGLLRFLCCSLHRYLKTDIASLVRVYTWRQFRMSMSFVRRIRLSEKLSLLVSWSGSDPTRKNWNILCCTSQTSLNFSTEIKYYEFRRCFIFNVRGDKLHYESEEVYSLVSYCLHARAAGLILVNTQTKRYSITWEYAPARKHVDRFDARSTATLA